MKNNVRQIIRDKREWHTPPDAEEAAKGFHGWHSRGYLPHFDKPGMIQFITFRLSDAVPDLLLREWKALLELPDERERRIQLEAFLDRGYGACHLRDPRVATVVQEALLFFDRERYRLLAWIIMPNHVHALVEVAQTPMSKILSSWKTFTAKQANRILGRTGTFWQTEYFDRHIRDEEHFRKAVHYIEWNPVKAHLVKSPQEWQWSSARRHSGDDDTSLQPVRSEAGGGHAQVIASNKNVKLADVDVRAPITLGIFAKTFIRPTLAGVLDAVVSHGFHCVQFNLACAGLPSLPGEIEPGVADRIRHELGARKVEMAAVSGTFNLIHPDCQKRRDGLRRLEVLARACDRLGAPVITLCTGTRDPEDMWRRHPDNDSSAAWRDLTASMQEALRIAEDNQVTLGIEPEVANVVDSARKARRLLDEMKSPRLKIVMDAANLFHAGELPRMREILEEAFELLGEDIVIAHAKDLTRDGEAGHEAAGKGVLDYNLYLRLLREAGFAGPLILHSLAEAEVGECVKFLRAKLRAIKPRRSSGRSKI